MVHAVADVPTVLTLEGLDIFRGPDKGDYWGPAFDKLAATWTMPFVMQGINTRVVRRSNALLGNAYGASPMQSPFTSMRADRCVPRILLAASIGHLVALSRTSCSPIF